MVSTATSGKLRLTVMQAKLTRDTETFGKMDPYAVIEYRQEKHKTVTKNNAGKTPVWNQTFDMDIKYIGDDIQIGVYDEDVTESDTIGFTTLKPSTLAVPGGITEWFDLQYHGKKAGQIQLRGVFTPAGGAN